MSELRLLERNPKFEYPAPARTHGGLANDRSSFHYRSAGRAKHKANSKVQSTKDRNPGFVSLVIQ
jgi:hypothetical protein